MAFFYRFVAAAMDLENLESPAVGMMTPYSALFVFAIGIFISNFLFNSLLMRKPFTGVPVAYSQYFKGNMNTHLVLILSSLFNIVLDLFFIVQIGTGTAGAAISYGLGQGATMVAALWGGYLEGIQRGSKSTNLLIVLMFVLFFLGLALIITSGGN
jgi:glucose uptake protein